MKGIGTIALVIGALGFLVTLSMDTTVGTGDLGRRVNNIGLINDKQNLLLLFSVISIVGAIFFALGKRSQVAPPPMPQVEQVTYSRERSCPFCAEMIKAEAIICRFCQRDVKGGIAEVKIDGEFAKPVSLGLRVVRLSDEKWEISPPSGGKVFAYSEADLERVLATYAKPPSAPDA